MNHALRACVAILMLGVGACATAADEPLQPAARRSALTAATDPRAGAAWDFAVFEPSGCGEPACALNPAAAATGLLPAQGIGGLASGATTFRIHRHDPNNGAELALTETRTWKAGWSFAKTFASGGMQFVFLLKANSGDALVRRLNDDGTLGPEVGTYALLRDVTSVEFFYPQGTPVLMLAQRQTGRVMMRNMLADGGVGALLQDLVSANVSHRDVVKPYRVAGAWYLLSLDRWHGRASILALNAAGKLQNGPPLYDETWTRGWSQAEFYEEGGATYVILYKVEQVPGLGQGGKFGVKRVLPGGLLDDAWVQGPVAWSEGYTHMHVSRARGPGATEGTPTSSLTTSPTAPRSLLWAYQIHSGALKVFALDETGVTGLLWSGSIGAGWTGLSGYVANQVPYLVKASEEGQVPFDYTMVADFREAIDTAYAGKLMGYQLAVMQSGRVVGLHAAGLSNRELEIPMSTLTRQAVASVSKMVTAVTTLKLVEDGVLALDDRMVDHMFIPTVIPHDELYYLPADQLLDPSLEDVRISELLTYTARFASKRSSHALWVGPRVAAACDPDLIDDTSWASASSMRCSDSYQNSPFGMLGFIILAHAGILPVAYANTGPYQEFSRNYWMRAALLDGMYCKAPPAEDAGHYQACMAGSSDCEDGFKTVPAESPGFCLSGSWRANAEDLVVLLAAMRYGKVLTPAMTELLLSKQLQSYNTATQAPGAAGSVAIGWNAGATTIAGMDEKGLGKAGGHEGVMAYVYHLPRAVDVAVVSNTSNCDDVPDPCPALGSTIVGAFADAVQN